MTACANLHLSAGNVLARLTPREAEVMAKKEIRRQGLPLPSNHKVTVVDSISLAELEESRPIYVVSFIFSYRGKVETVYTVHIDKRSKKTSVSDLRKAIPSAVKTRKK
jgi:hypothetical protein